MSESNAKIVEVTDDLSKSAVVSGKNVVFEVTFVSSEDGKSLPQQSTLSAQWQPTANNSKAVTILNVLVVTPQGGTWDKQTGLRLAASSPSVTLQITIETDELKPGDGAIEFYLNRERDSSAAEARVPLRIASPKLAALPTLAKEIVDAVAPIRTITSKDVMATRWTDDVLLYAVIKQSCAGLSFNNYQACLNELFSPGNPNEKKRIELNKKYTELKKSRYLPFTDSEAYRLLVVATEAFVAVQSTITPKEAVNNGVIPADVLNRILSDLNASDTPERDNLESRFAQQYCRSLGVAGNGEVTLPYLQLIANKLGTPSAGLPSSGENAASALVIAHKLARPVMIELIWSYWHEQGMQARTMHALRDRFLNRRTGPTPDPIASFEINGMGILANLFYKHFQDAQHRVPSIVLAHEYAHHYGFPGVGNPGIQTVDSRSRFLEAFHNLLGNCVIFFREDDDTNRRADAFPLLNALKEVHFLLSEGAHNQYGDLPTTARTEMLLEQWLLARPELQKFLPSRDSVAYPEPWMGSVDAMKTIQGWTNTSVMYFHDLANFGEQILLSIRFNNWSIIADRTHAANWARVWRSELQGYMHAYRTVTGVDLTNDAKDPQVLAERNLDPSIHLMRRYREQQQAGLAVRGAGRLPGVPTAVLGRSRPASLPAPKNH